MVSYSRAKEVIDYATDYGVHSAAAEYELSVETVRRYERVIENPIPEEKTGKVERASVLVFDIETAPIKAAIWNRFPKYVDYGAFDADWFVLCWSAKWLGKPEILRSVMDSDEAISQDDSRIVKELWTLFDEADIVVAHNGNGFDVPRMNARFMLHGLPPPSPFKIVDTLTSTRKVFQLSSYKMDDILTWLGMEGKFKTGMKLWQQCYTGDTEALTKMSSYCNNDVVILESMYLRVRPYFKSHPPIYRSFDGSEICPLCGSFNLQKLNAVHLTKVSAFPTYRCDCGYIVRGRKSVKKGQQLVSL